mmetsp:Transcript_153326/g.271828  ORF Transcript_153326/g.271828 Transcript_153326/m.271828 type:complete len:882 (-) Transcript_153326:110-2755(-)
MTEQCRCCIQAVKEQCRSCIENVTTWIRGRVPRLHNRCLKLFNKYVAISRAYILSLVFIMIFSLTLSFFVNMVFVLQANKRYWDWLPNVCVFGGLPSLTIFIAFILQHCVNLFLDVVSEKIPFLHLRSRLMALIVSCWSKDLLENQTFYRCFDVFFLFLSSLAPLIMTFLFRGTGEYYQGYFKSLFYTLTILLFISCFTNFFIWSKASHQGEEWNQKFLSTKNKIKRGMEQSSMLIGSMGNLWWYSIMVIFRGVLFFSPFCHDLPALRWILRLITMVLVIVVVMLMAFEAPYLAPWFWARCLDVVQVLENKKTLVSWRCLEGGQEGNYVQVFEKFLNGVRAPPPTPSAEPLLGTSHNNAYDAGDDADTTGGSQAASPASQSLQGICRKGCCRLIDGCKKVWYLCLLTLVLLIWAFLAYVIQVLYHEKYVMDILVNITFVFGLITLFAYVWIAAQHLCSSDWMDFSLVAIIVVGSTAVWVIWGLYVAFAVDFLHFEYKDFVLRTFLIGIMVVSTYVCVVSQHLVGSTFFLTLTFFLIVVAGFLFLDFGAFSGAQIVDENTVGAITNKTDRSKVAGGLFHESTSPVCGLSFGAPAASLSAIDLGILSWYAYANLTTANASVISSFGYLNHKEFFESEPSVKSLSCANTSMLQVDFNSKDSSHKGTTVVAIRGTADIFGLNMDVSGYTAVQLLQFANTYLVPVLSLMPLPLLQDWLSKAKSDLIKKEFEETFECVKEVQENVKARGNKVVLTGHSLGGLFAEVVGSKLGLETLVFSAPGFELMQKAFDIADASTSSTSEYTVVVPYGDPIPRVDRHPGNVQHIECNVNKTLRPETHFLSQEVNFGCHSITRTVCELERTCARKKSGRFMACDAADRFDREAAKR